MDLPVFVDFSSDYISLHPTFDSKKVSERQKILQLLVEISQIVNKYEVLLRALVVTED